MNIKQQEKVAVANLLERALAVSRSDTVLVPIRKLHRDDNHRPHSPPKAKADVTTSIDSNSISGFSTGMISDSGLSFSSFIDSSCMDYVLRDRIKVIESKIKSSNDRKELPSIVLPASLCSWDRRISDKYSDRSRPPVNIIGCHQPADLIVARADERVRKQVNAKEMKEKHVEELSRYIEHLIEMKLTRGERYALLLEKQKRQILMLKIIYSCIYMRNLIPTVKNIKRLGQENNRSNTAAKILQRSMSNWYDNRCTTKFSDFEKNIKASSWRIEMFIKIFQKNRAAKIIRTHLYERKEKRYVKMTHIVHSFLKGVRLIQRTARNFIECKQYRIRSLERLWLDLEKQYLCVTLASKQSEVVKTSSSDLKNVVVDTKTRIEMEKQNDRWLSTSKKFERILDFHRSKGDLDATVQESEGIDCLLLPYSFRKAQLEQILHQKRKEHVLKLQDVQNRLKKSCLYSEEDAISFLKGNMNPSIRLNDGAPTGVAVKNFVPFSVFKNLSDDEILNQIKKFHKERKTFVITPQNVGFFSAAMRGQCSLKGNGSTIGGVIVRRSSCLPRNLYEDNERAIQMKLIHPTAANRKKMKKEVSKKV